MKTFRKPQWLFTLSFFIALSACSSQPPYTDSNLDSKAFVDSILIDPTGYLVSASDQFPDISKPAIITAHGYTATPFEWLEFKNYLKAQDSTVYISRVLLGGHGRSYDDFNKTTWQQWQKPILEEYLALYDMGFRNISLAGSSTGCPLILDLIAKNAFGSTIAPKHIFFIDPIVQPSNKMLKYVQILGVFVPYVEVDVSPAEERYWYKYRGKESLVQLYKTIKQNHKHLKEGITLPEATKTFQVYKVKTDDSAHPESARWLYDGIRFSDGSPIDTFMLSSDLHVFTRLKGRENYTQKDVAYQQDAFNTLYNKLISK